MWKQGEHVCIIGDTGSGKTYLETRLLDYRRCVIVLRTKPDDNRFPGYRVIRSIRDISLSCDKYLLVPPYEKQRLECARALDMVWRQGSWCIAIDELFYATNDLHLTKLIDRLLTQGRSKRITVVCGMQRPVGITRNSIAQATHVFSFECEGRDVKTIAEATTPRIALPVQALKPRQFIYFNRRTRELVKGTAQTVERVLENEASHPYGRSALVRVRNGDTGNRTLLSSSR